MLDFFHSSSSPYFNVQCSRFINQGPVASKNHILGLFETNPIIVIGHIDETSAELGLQLDLPIAIDYEKHEHLRCSEPNTGLNHVFDATADLVRTASKEDFKHLSQLQLVLTVWRLILTEKWVSSTFLSSTVLIQTSLNFGIDSQWNRH